METPMQTFWCDKPISIQFAPCGIRCPCVCLSGAPGLSSPTSRVDCDLAGGSYHRWPCPAGRRTVKTTTPFPAVPGWARTNPTPDHRQKTAPNILPCVDVLP